MLLKSKRAFTLIELLVVVLMIGILSAIALPQYTNAVEKSRFSEVMATAANLRNALDLWILENGYPTSRICFLGDNCAGAGQLMVELESGADCSALSGTACAGKNFTYTALCNQSTCVVEFRRLINGEEAYAGEWRHPKGGTWRGGDCYYYPDVSSTGKTICTLLKSQDENFHPCEDC